MLGITDYLWRLLPGNPILLRVVETGGKRRRDLLIRCGYLGLLILLVLLSLYSSNVTGASLGELAKTSTKVFQNLSYLQLGLVALLAPVFTAGAITQEKDSQTYDILLATPLSNGQIVLGSLLSRLFFVVILLVSGIPIFSITQIFGGVAIRYIFLSFGIAAATAFVTGAMAMAIATFKVGTRRTIFSFYLFIVVYLIGTYLLDAVPYFHPVVGYDVDPATKVQKPIPALTSWLTGLNPFLALRTIFFDKAYTPPDSLPADLKPWPWGWYLTDPAGFYVTFMFTLSTVLVLPSIVLLRWVAQTNLSFKTWVLTKLKLSTGDKTRRPRTVWSNPIAWREAKTKASAVKASALRYAFMAAGVIAAVVLAVEFSEVDPAPSFITARSYDTATSTLTVFGRSPHQYHLNTKAEVAEYQRKLSGYEDEKARRIAAGEPPQDAPAPTEVAAPKIQFKDAPSAEPRDASLADLRYGYAAVVNANGDNSIDTVTLSRQPHHVSEATVRDYLLGAVVLEFAVILLIVTNAAASTVTREKEDGTLDLLLTTPITSRYYIWGKLRGLVSFVLPLVAVPVASVLVFVLYDLIRFSGNANPSDRWIAFPESVILMPAMLVIVAAFAAILGMQMSLRCRTTVLAVMSSVGIVVGLCGAMGWCGYTLLDSRDGGGPSLFVGGFSPFTLLTLLISPYRFAEHAYNNGPDSDPAANREAVLVSSLIAVGVYTAVVWAMYKSMVKNFDMTIRRQQR